MYYLLTRDHLRDSLWMELQRASNCDAICLKGQNTTDNVCIYVQIHEYTHCIFIYTYAQKHIHQTGNSDYLWGGDYNGEVKVVKACNIYKEIVFVLRISNN